MDNSVASKEDKRGNRAHAFKRLNVSPNIPADVRSFLFLHLPVKSSPVRSVGGGGSEVTKDGCLNCLKNADVCR